MNLSSILPNRLSTVGVQVTWDVYDWGRKRKQGEEKRLAEEQAQRNAEAVGMREFGQRMAVDQHAGIREREQRQDHVRDRVVQSSLETV